MVRSEHKIDLVGFGVLRFAQQKEREGAGIPGGCSSPAKGRAGEYATNGAAAGPVVAASKGTTKGGGKWGRNRDEPEREGCQRADLERDYHLKLEFDIASRAEVEPSLRPRRAYRQARPWLPVGVLARS